MTTEPPKETPARLGSHWEVPVTWHRIITGYDRDTDIFMLGLGWRL